MKTQTARLLRIFVTGLLAALPLAATVAIFAWAVSVLIGWLGPQSAVGGLLVAVGFGVAGSEIVGYLLGVALVAALVFALGVLVETGFQRGAARLVETVLARIPLVGTVYDLARRIVGLFKQGGSGGMKQMSAVWVHFGGVRAEGEAGGVIVLGLLSTPTAVMVEGRACLAVIVPTSPVPMGGGLLYVPAGWVQPADVGVEALTSIYVSMGITSSQYLPAAPAAGAAPLPPAAVPRAKDQAAAEASSSA
jgi:uncharacterized membrane protein